MTLEEADYLRRARGCLDEAKIIYTVGLAAVAARSAYYAGFHAAQAYILKMTDKIAKTHSGVRAEFSRLAKDVSQIDDKLKKIFGPCLSIQRDQ